MGSHWTTGIAFYSHYLCYLYGYQITTASLLPLVFQSFSNVLFLILFSISSKGCIKLILYKMTLLLLLKSLYDKNLEAKSNPVSYTEIFISAKCLETFLA